MVIAFIPVRGGSKSIPLKNIKPFCGKPLVCWNIEALEQCKEVDEIIVATDSDKIEEVVVSRPYKKNKNLSPFCQECLRYGKYGKRDVGIYSSCATFG